MQAQTCSIHHLNASAKEWLEAHTLASNTSADAALPMRSCIVPILVPTN